MLCLNLYLPELYAIYHWCGEQCLSSPVNCTIVTTVRQLWRCVDPLFPSRLVMTRHGLFSDSSIAQIPRGLSHLDTTRNVRRVDPFWLCRACRTALLTRSTRRTCRVKSRRDVTTDEPSGIWAYACSEFWIRLSVEEMAQDLSTPLTGKFPLHSDGSSIIVDLSVHMGRCFTGRFFHIKKSAVVWRSYWPLIYILATSSTAQTVATPDLRSRETTRWVMWRRIAVASARWVEFTHWVHTTQPRWLSLCSRHI